MDLAVRENCGSFVLVAFVVAVVVAAAAAAAFVRRLRILYLNCYKMRPKSCPPRPLFWVELHSEAPWPFTRG